MVSIHWYCYIEDDNSVAYGIPNPFHLNRIFLHEFTWCDFEWKGFIKYRILPLSDFSLMPYFLGGQQQKSNLCVTGTSSLLAGDITGIVNCYLKNKKINEIKNTWYIYGGYCAIYIINNCTIIHFVPVAIVHGIAYTSNASCFRLWFCTCKAILGRGQPGLMRQILLWIMLLV